MDSGKPIWMKQLYFNHLLPFARMLDNEWVGPHGDVAFQVNIMDKPSMRVKRHRDHQDISFQYGVGLGSYEGGDVLVYNQKEETGYKICIKRQVVRLDGRFFHEAMPITSGIRFSIYIYKGFDRLRSFTEPLQWPPSIVYWQNEIMPMEKIDVPPDLLQDDSKTKRGRRHKQM